MPKPPAKRTRATARTTNAQSPAKASTKLAAKTSTKQAAKHAATRPAKHSPTRVAKNTARKSVTPSSPTGARSDQSVVRDVRFALPDGSIVQWDGVADEQLLVANEFQRVAMQWTYIVRNRRRWAEREVSVNEQADRARQFLQRLGMSESARERLAFAGHVEVVIPWTSEAIGWELRIMPWEYVLSAGTRDLRRGVGLSVVRRLDVGGSLRQLSEQPCALYVQSAVGELADAFDFSAERRMVQSALAGEQFHECINPTLDELAQAVAVHRPEIVHLAGFDTHQGLALMNDGSAGKVLDGYLLRGATGAVEAVSAQQIAKALTCGTAKPALVTLNLHNSAGRIAPMLISEGIGAALAFQDTFDDALAELFFSSFYHALSMADGDLVLAFDLAWAEMREQPRSVQGSGLALWSGTPLLAPAVSSTPTTRSQIDDVIAKERAQVLDPASITDLAEVVKVTVEPFTEVNYSLLHNNRGLFKEFSIRKLKPGRLERIEVNVELHAGSDSYPYRRTLTLSEQFIDLNELVRVPLTSVLSRSRGEAMRTSLYVEVLWGPPGSTRELYRDTTRVTLLPADQWRDDDTDRMWLPSFVLPRDPAVSRIIDQAQRYLMALRDDPTAGFDGYQSIDARAGDPYECVDLQVQAIWSAILYDCRLAYVNPPPTYSIASQRVRTPSEILASGRGTCLDLTLLLAACCEYVEIYPVVFLLAGHAFPGYWRSADAHAAFGKVALTDTEVGVTGDDERLTRATGQREAWHLPAAMWPEVIQQVRSGALVPLESVWLTSHKGFADAVDAGYENLKSRDEFDALLDVLLARGRDVTPLPIREEPS